MTKEENRSLSTPQTDAERIADEIQITESSADYWESRETEDDHPQLLQGRQIAATYALASAVYEVALQLAKTRERGESRT